MKKPKPHRTRYSFTVSRGGESIAVDVYANGTVQARRLLNEVIAENTHESGVHRIDLTEVKPLD